MKGRLLRDSAWILGVVSTVYAGILVWAEGWGADSHAYWLAWNGPMFTTGPMTPGAYLYSPAFAHALWPLAALPWPIFAAMWSVLLGVGLVWLLMPLGSRWAVPLFLAGLPELVSGNVFVLLAVVCVIGARHPSAWAFAALTKITPCLGPVWFASRREWRNLGVTIAGTAGVAAVSFALSPQLWAEWVDFLSRHASQSGGALGSPALPGLVYRLPLALILVVWGARVGHPWVLPVGMLLATPVLWLGSFVLLAALPRMVDLPTPRKAAAVVLGGSSVGPPENPS